jgi:hypothetical protein
MSEETIWTDAAADLSIRLARRPAPEVLDLLQRTVWGGGKLRYRILDIPETLRRMSDPHFLTLRRGADLVAICVLNRRVTRLLGKPCDSFHFAMLATEPRFAGQRYASLLADHAGAFCHDTLPAPGVAYAFVEATTKGTVSISNHFAPPFEAMLPLTVFSRFRPKDDAHAGALTEHEEEDVIRRLSTLYQGHAFDDFDSSLIPDDYSVLRNQGEVVAGAQAEELTWSVEELPGLSGKLILTLPRYLPPLRRILNPANLRFLRFSNLLVEPGREPDLIRLMEAMLHRRKAPLGLILMDERSPVYQRIKAHDRFGLLARAVRGATKMVGDFRSVPEADIARIRDRPALMSPMDVF